MGPRVPKGGVRHLPSPAISLRTNALRYKARKKTETATRRTNRGLPSPDMAPQLIALSFIIKPGKGGNPAILSPPARAKSPAEPLTPAAPLPIMASPSVQ